MAQTLDGKQRFDHVLNGDKRVKVFEVKRTNYQFMYVDEDDFMSLLGEDGEVRSDMRLVSRTETCVERTI